MTTTEIGAGDPKGAKRAKSEIQTKENKTHKTKITIEDISQEPIIDPTAQYNLIQQIIQADISDPLLLGKSHSRTIGTLSWSLQGAYIRPTYSGLV